MIGDEEADRNVAVCRRAIEAVADNIAKPPAGAVAGLKDQLLPLLDADIELHDPDLPGGGRFTGHEGVLSWLGQLAEVFEDATVEAERFFDSGDEVVGFLRFAARGKGSGAQTEIRDAHLWSLHEGKIARWRTYIDRKRALADAGIDTDD